jgi:2-keto-4-pentenoate hydratase/2-oxohepta-3-ene-1,7-dioic acid hydratase in catechol pathway
VRLARYSIDGVVGLGLITDSEDGVVAIEKHLPAAPSDVLELIARWDDLRPELEALARRPADFRLGAVRLLAPVPRPGKMLAMAMNYADHVAEVIEAGIPVPDCQVWFSKAATAANGPFDPISLPRVSDRLDYEAELVIVIGKPCRYATREQAADAIFGYCVGNDVSVRDWQTRTSQWMLGKSFDSHGPHGPWIVTKDAVDPMTLDLTCTVNGEVRQSSNTRHLISDPIAEVEYLSQAMTLEPGDLLFTGTPGGCGCVRRPPTFLKVGDVVRVTIGGLGSIENQVVAD